MGFAENARRIHARTPSERDRYADFLRIASICVVVLGHWLVAVVLVRNGEIITGRLLAFEPWTQWSTWILQVMPIFFIVGGFVNAGSWQRAMERTEPWAMWVRRRCKRLLTPLVPLVALWVPLVLALEFVGGLPAQWIQTAGDVVFIPAWFLAVYLMVIGTTAPTWWLHRRFGVWVFGPLVVVAGIVDMLHRAGVPWIGFVNFWVVWVAVHQIGYFWYDKRLPWGAAGAVGAIIVGLGLLLILVSFAGYPLSMVAEDPDAPSNTSPPSLALLALTVAQLGLLLLLRRPLEGWLNRPRPWAAVVVAGSVTITVFLWHMTALVLVTALTHPTGIWPASSQIDSTWWWLRPPWLVLNAVVLAALVAIFARFERPPAPAFHAGVLRAAVGLVAAVAGTSMLVAGGLYHPDPALRLPWVALALLILGLLALGVLQPRRMTQDDRSSGP